MADRERKISEDGEWRIEDSGRNGEDGGLRMANGGRPEVRRGESVRWRIGGQKSGIRSQKSEVGGRRSEDRRQRP